jgi:hypothetical protein
VGLLSILRYQGGPGDAALAGSWENTYGLTSAVWADTTDHVLNNFTIPLGGGMYPSAMVVNLETMEFEGYATGMVQEGEEYIEQILDDDHPCAP